MDARPSTSLRCLLLWLIPCLGGGLASAGTSPAYAADGGGDVEFDAVASLDDTALQSLRGGFLTRSGLEVTFGIERSLSLNNAVQAAATLRLSTPPGASASDVPYTLIQSGPLNLAPAALPAGLASIIQNSLDQQKIGVTTTLNITVSNLASFRAAAMGEMLRLQLIESVRGGR